MAIAEYEFSIYDDFPINHKVDITILQQEIEAEESITQQLHHIDANLDNDLCVVYFYDVLTTTEEDILSNLIAAHTGELPGGGSSGDGSASIGGEGPSDISFVYGDQYDDYFIYFKHTDYKVGTQFIFRGTSIIGTPKGVKAILTGQGRLRLYDRTNNLVLFEWRDIDLSDWAIFSHTDIEWPENEAILELQGRETCSSDKNLYCSNFMICFIGNVVDNLPSGISV